MPQTAPILKNKLYLYLTEFFAGVAVMAVELGANRLLAPYFSSSQIVWTIIIGTIMIAMALGNLYGGRAADRNPDPACLYRRILIAAIWIAAIPVLGKYIIIGISGLMILAINTGFLIWASFLACMVLFVFPLFLLGTTTPSLARYTVESVGESGSIMGRLGACNTIGSIIGTFLPTFVTIPAVGASATFLIFSGILLVLALLYFISAKQKKVLCIVSVILFILCAIFGRGDRFAFWEEDLAYEGESVYNYLQVRDGNRATILSTNVLFGVQSIHMKQGGLTGLYYDYALAAPLLCREDGPKDMLILGMGTGTYATLCQRYFPEIRSTGVEIDEKITNLAHTYFELDPDIPVVTYDGRAYLAGVKDTYDIIMVDAYRDITIPFQMSSLEFFRAVAAHLNPGGVLIMNMNMYSESENSITDYLADTVAALFPSVATVDVLGSTNRELFASMDADMLDRLTERLANGPADAAGAGSAAEGTGGAASDKDPGASSESSVSESNPAGSASLEEVATLYDFLRSITPEIRPYEAGSLLLTDDKAPVEVLGMQVIDELIQNELGTYKELFREEGISGLLSSF